jgi:translation initiation factor IF-3
LVQGEVNREIIKKLRINAAIKVGEVRLVGEKGEQLGIMSKLQALDTARKQNLDLVEVAATAVPPVCRLLDYGKYKYEQAKKARQAKKIQKVSVLREIRVRPKIGDHDFQAKKRTAEKLLSEGNKVKATVLFRGREITHPDIGWRLLQRMSESLKEIALVEGKALMEGKRMSIILLPVASQKTKVSGVISETQKTKAKEVKRSSKKTEGILETTINGKHTKVTEVLMTQTKDKKGTKES